MYTVQSLWTQAREGLNITNVIFSNNIKDEIKKSDLIIIHTERNDFKNINFELPPENTAHGALLKHITMNANPETFQPMNINFGLMPDINVTGETGNKKYLKGREKKKIQAKNASSSLK